MTQSDQPQKTSRDRFADFKNRFRKGEFKQELLDEKDSGKSEAESKSGIDPEKKKKRRGYLRLYIRRLGKHWPMVVVLVVLALSVACLDMIQPLFMRHIIDSILLSDDSTSDKLANLHFVALIYIGIVIASQALGFLRSWNQQLLNIRVILTLRRALFEKLLRLPLDRLSEMKTGGIISRLTDDINKTTGLLQMAVISPGVAIVRLLIAMVILFVVNWKLALTALAIIPPIMLISFMAIRRIRPIYRAIRKEVSFVDGRVGEAFQGIRAVRAFLGERREEHEYTVGHHSITRMRMFAHSREIILWSSWGFLMSLIAVVITWAGGYWYVFGNATIGDITAFHFYTFLLLNPVWALVESVSELQRSMASMERVFEVLESPDDKPDDSEAVDVDAQVDEICFENVSFSYDGETNVLKNIDLTVQGGSVVALVGRSGAGKSTFTDLVARFYDPTDGRIALNGRDLRKYRLQSFRDLLGVVQQEVFLFDGSIRDNIAYSNRNATDDQVRDAAQRANAEEFIVNLPEQYDSVIGERGVKLSGGQRQRLSIARALLANPQILILDEATSNLDTESEQLIQQSMKELLRNRTTFVIAHRLSTITHADQIVVMEDGEIVEVGTHQDLLARGGAYAEMVKRQNRSISDFG